ncbi:hypothetical protein RCL1_006295 [Eukaryota sp. TZLM3-RCL]
MNVNVLRLSVLRKVALRPSLTTQQPAITKKTPSSATNKSTVRISVPSPCSVSPTSKKVRSSSSCSPRVLRRSLSSPIKPKRCKSSQSIVNNLSTKINHEAVVCKTNLPPKQPKNLLLKSENFENNFEELEQHKGLFSKSENFENNFEELEQPKNLLLKSENFENNFEELEQHKGLFSKSENFENNFEELEQPKNLLSKPENFENNFEELEQHKGLFSKSENFENNFEELEQPKNLLSKPENFENNFEELEQHKGLFSKSENFENNFEEIEQPKNLLSKPENFENNFEELEQHKGLLSKSENFENNFEELEQHKGLLSKSENFENNFEELEQHKGLLSKSENFENNFEELEQPKNLLLKSENFENNFEELEQHKGLFSKSENFENNFEELEQPKNLLLKSENFENNFEELEQHKGLFSKSENFENNFEELEQPKNLLLKSENFENNFEELEQHKGLFSKSENFENNFEELEQPKNLLLKSENFENNFEELEQHKGLLSKSENIEELEQHKGLLSKSENIESNFEVEQTTNYFTFLPSISSIFLKFDPLIFFECQKISNCTTENNSFVFSFNEESKFVLLTAIQNFETNISDSFVFDYNTCLSSNLIIIWGNFKTIGKNYFPELPPLLFQSNLFLRFQTISKLSNPFPLTSKEILAKYLTNHPNLPVTFDIPLDFIKLSDYLKSKSNDSLFLVKGKNSSRGRNISLHDCKSLMNEFSVSSQIIVQEYIKNPLLIFNRKFDLRIYVAVLESPFQVLIYNEGFCRFSSCNYSLKNFDLFIHLTNTSLQNSKENPYLKNISPPIEDPLLLKSEEKSNKCSISSFKNFCQKSNINFEQIWVEIKSIINDCFVSAEKFVNKCKSVPPNKSFEIFGFDFLIDSNCKPWLLEINSAPSMSFINNLDNIKIQMLTDIIAIINPIKFNSQILIKYLTNMNQNSNRLSKERSNSLFSSIFGPKNEIFERKFDANNNWEVII